MKRRAWPLVLLALLAGVGTLWYLTPFGWALMGNYAAALVVLALPLWRWLPTARYGRIAAAWVVAGLVGAYFFGTLVLAAGLLAAVGMGARVVARRCRLRSVQVP